MALEYARSEGWMPPQAEVECEKCSRLETSLAETCAALAAEVESHAVTKRALLRGTKKRVAELEAALREVINAIDLTEGDLKSMAICEAARRAMQVLG